MPTSYERQNFANILERIVEEKARGILLKADCLNLPEQALAQAKQEIARSWEIENEVLEIQMMQAERTEHKLIADKLEENIEKAYDRLADQLSARGRLINKGRWASSNFETTFNAEAGKILPAIMSSMGEAGAKYAELMQIKKTLRARMALTTTNKAIVDFMKSVCDQIGVAFERLYEENF